MKNSSFYYSVGPLLYCPADREDLAGSLICGRFGTGYFPVSLSRRHHRGSPRERSGTDSDSHAENAVQREKTKRFLSSSDFHPGQKSSSDPLSAGTARRGGICRKRICPSEILGKKRRRLPETDRRTPARRTGAEFTPCPFSRVRISSL